MLFVLSAGIILGASSGQSATVQYHPGTNSPPTLSLEPTNPTAADVVRFTAALDGQIKGNACYAAWDYRGYPYISIDHTGKTVGVTWRGPIMPFCNDVWDPVNGLEGELGTLEAGEWTFVVDRFSQSSFVIRPDDPVLDIKPMPSSGHIQFSWRTNFIGCVLETLSSLSSTNWSAVTNTPTVVGSRAVLTIESTNQTAFFRLRRFQ